MSDETQTTILCDRCELYNKWHLADALKAKYIRQMEDGGLPVFGNVFWSAVSLSVNELKRNRGDQIVSLLQAKISRHLINTHKGINKYLINNKKKRKNK